MKLTFSYQWRIENQTCNIQTLSTFHPPQVLYFSVSAPIHNFLFILKEELSFLLFKVYLSTCNRYLSNSAPSGSLEDQLSLSSCPYFQYLFPVASFFSAYKYAQVSSFFSCQSPSSQMVFFSLYFHCTLYLLLFSGHSILCMCIKAQK